MYAAVLAAAKQGPSELAAVLAKLPPPHLHLLRCLKVHLEKVASAEAHNRKSEI